MKELFKVWKWVPSDEELVGASWKYDWIDAIDEERFEGRFWEAMVLNVIWLEERDDVGGLMNDEDEYRFVESIIWLPMTIFQRMIEVKGPELDRAQKSLRK